MSVTEVCVNASLVSEANIKFIGGKRRASCVQNAYVRSLFDFGVDAKSMIYFKLLKGRELVRIETIKLYAIFVNNTKESKLVQPTKVTETP